MCSMPFVEIRSAHIPGAVGPDAQERHASMKAASKLLRVIVCLKDHSVPRHPTSAIFMRHRRKHAGTARQAYFFTQRVCARQPDANQYATERQPVQSFRFAFGCQQPWRRDMDKKDPTRVSYYTLSFQIERL